MNYEAMIQLSKTFSNNQISLHAGAAFRDTHIDAEPAFTKTVTISSFSALHHN